jgi:hypothetical protein
MHSFTPLAVALGLTACFVVMASGRPTADVIRFSETPRDLQIYPRNLETNEAVVRFSGEVLNSRYAEIRLQAYRGSDPWGEPQTRQLAFAGGPAPFAFTSTIRAELVDYQFDLSLVRRGRSQRVARIRNVAAGDAYLVNGGDNAMGGCRAGSSAAEQHPLLRSFGSRDSRVRTARSDLKWHRAEGDALEGPGAVGQWALRFGRLMIERHGVPVAILNGADREKSIGFFQPSSGDPSDPLTNYGRLLFRATEAGLNHHTRAVMWYQGERDEGNAAVHRAGVQKLAAAWRKDYSALEKIYLFQVRPGCGVEQWEIGLREAQRALADQIEDVNIVSTTGLDEHDGCHFAYVGGYDQLAERIAALVDRDLFGMDVQHPVGAPNPAGAFFSTPDHSEITIHLRRPDETLVFDPGAEKDFRLEHSEAAVVSGRIETNAIVLTLSTNGFDASAISYAGHAFAGPWVTNATGNGLLSFAGLPIDRDPPVAPTALTAIAPSCERVFLTWNPAENATAYRIHRDGEFVAETSHPEFTDATLPYDTTFHYSVAAANPGGTSEYGEAVSVSTPPVPPPPGIPMGLRINVRSDRRVDLQWTEVKHASAYWVERDGQPLDRVHEAAYRDPDAPVGRVVSYRLAAANPGATSGWSAAVSATTIVDNVFIFVPEAHEYTLVYALNVPDDLVVGSTGTVVYTRDLSASITSAFDRIAYYVELRNTADGPTGWAYASMDAFTGDIGRIGVPTRMSGAVFQQPVSNLNVQVSPGLPIPAGTGLEGGTIEFWGYTYVPKNVRGVLHAADAAYDAGDEISRAGTYGSMQIHILGETVFAYNRWGVPGVDDLGIGNAPDPHRDWTFSETADDYASKIIQVLVRIVTD